MSKCERIEVEHIQVADWYQDDIEALRTLDARYTDLKNMWMDDSRGHAFGANQAQSETKKWIEIMEGRPYQEGNRSMASDPAKAPGDSSRCMPSVGGWVTPYSPPPPPSHPTLRGLS